jgi:hypothetical protein
MGSGQNSPPFINSPLVNNEGTLKSATQQKLNQGTYAGVITLGLNFVL